VTRIPHAKVVAKAIRSVRSAIQKSLEGVNQLAGQRMAKGDYPNAELLIAKAKELRQFQSEVDANETNNNATLAILSTDLTQSNPVRRMSPATGLM
jgi:hypothetical protein